ncbi:MAG TPA: hypothetical protein VK439_14475, partial [Rubrivivax sp.]|nr:hypothetical protein [Rubrivivax sp.]
MKLPRPAWRVAAAAVGVLVLGVVVCEVSGWPFLRQPLQNAATRAAGVPVVLEGRFRTHLLWRPRMEVEHLNIAPGGNVAVPHLVDARNVQLAWGWADVWRWRQDDETPPRRPPQSSARCKTLKQPAESGRRSEAPAS